MNTIAQAAENAPVGTTQKVYTNTVVVEAEGDYEDVVEGGSTARHKVISCDVDPEKGILEYYRRSFPAVPYFGPEPRPETVPIPGMHSKHVSTMSSLLDEEIDELREAHGITIVYK